MRVSLDFDCNFQPVAAGNSPRWMQNNRVTDQIAFRIKRFLHGKRADTRSSRQHGSFATALKRQTQRGFPATLRNCLSQSHTAMKLRTLSISMSAPDPVFTTSPR